jgi:small GTP-binding protein
MARSEQQIFYYSMNDLVTYLDELKQLAEGVAGKDLIDSIEELRNKLQQEKLYIVVLGLFKRGKSSLINSLVGKNIAPVAVTPVTAIITLIEYSETESYIEIVYKNGQEEKKNISEIGMYVSEEENPANKLNVEVVRIFDNSPLLKKLTLVDTPGLGSAFEHNTETTLRFIPKIDAAIFVVSADMPVSKLDIEFLNELKEITPNIIFVLNKSDLLKEIELAKMLQHDLEIISSVLKKDSSSIQIIPVSTKNNFNDDNIRNLRNKISSLAEKDKAQILQESGVRQYRLLKKQLTSLLQLKLDGLLMPLNELEQRQQQFKDSILLLQRQKDEFQIIINGKIKQLDQYIHETVNSIRHGLDKEIWERIQNEFLPHDVYKDKTSLYAFQKELNQLVLTRFGETKDKMEAETKQHFRNLLEQYSSRSQSFLNELAKNLSALMGLDFNLIAERFDLNVYTAFYLTLEGGEQPIDFGNGPFNFLLSPDKRKMKMADKIRAHFKEVTNANTASIIYDLQYKVQESFRKFNYDLGNRLKELLQNIEEVISDTIQKKNETRESVESEIISVRSKIHQLTSSQ